MSIILNLLNKIKSKSNSSKYLIKKFNKNDVKHVCNLQKDLTDERDYHVKSIVKLQELPKSVDLREYCNTIKQQGSLGCCSGFAFGAAFETMKNIQTKSLNEWDTSELYIYFYERKLMGTIEKDSGAYLRDGCKVLKDYGSSLEQYWPYDISKFKKAPSWTANLVGGITRIESYYRCWSLDDIKFALSQKMPVVFGMYVYRNYLEYNGGIYNKIDGYQAGGHAQLLVGFDDEQKYLIVRNSWGENWGDKGYCYLSYDMFNKLFMDAWVIIPFGYNNLK